MKIYEVQRAFIANNRSDQQLRAFLFNVQTYCENSRHLNIEQIIDAFVSTHSMFPSFDAAVESLFDLAVEASLTKAMQENRIIPLTMDDLQKQAKAIVPSSKAWFESAKNYALYSNQSGLYDPILSFLGIKK